MLIVIEITIFLFYASLVIELFLYAIPSVVSTKNLISTNNSLKLEKFQYVLKWSILKKIIILGLPLIGSYIVHCFPLYFLFQISQGNFQIHYVLLCSLGLLLVVLGRLWSHFYLYKMEKIKNQHFKGFVTKGIFKWSRNPGLMGLYMSFFGFLLIEPSILFFISFVIYMLHMHFRVVLEEDYLKTKYGVDYLNYLNRVRRYI